MKNFIFDLSGNKIEQFEKISIEAGSDFSEKWLQNVVYQNIELLNVCDPNFDKIKIIPLCREFSLNDSRRNVFLDILAVTETGKLVLVECKLWKNPQSRREVIAQIIEYASLMKNLSYSDLTAYLKKYINSKSSDPIQFRFTEMNITFNEIDLVDRISKSLKSADFHLIIAGDGIRSDILGIAETLNRGASLSGNLSLLELPIYRSSSGNLLITPRLPFNTETIKKTIFVSPAGDVLESSENFDDPVNILDDITSRLSTDERQATSDFWNNFISTVKFDHPDQSSPRKGGYNWVKIDFPDPFKTVAGYRTAKTYGIFAYTKQFDHNFFDLLNLKFNHLKEMIGENLIIKHDKSKNRILIECDCDNQIDDIKISSAEQNQKIADLLNKFVNVMRPICHEYNSINSLQAV